VLRLAPFFFYERKGLRKFIPSTLLSLYICVMLLIFLFCRLAIIVGNIFNVNMNNVYSLAAMMKSSVYVISHNCFLFTTLLFLGEVVNFLHVLLSFNNVPRCHSPNPSLLKHRDTIPHAVNLSLTLLKMGKKLPETC